MAVSSISTRRWVPNTSGMKTRLDIHEAIMTKTLVYLFSRMLSRGGIFPIQVPHASEAFVVMSTMTSIACNIICTAAHIVCVCGVFWWNSHQAQCHITQIDMKISL